MTGSNVEKDVAAHYSRGQVAERILSSLALAEAEPGSVSVDTLFSVDQLHHGGVGLTAAMAKAAAVKKRARVLDAGSGIGGSARYLADRFGCQVTGVDLSAEFVEAARVLDRLVGLTNQITHDVGSVTALPHGDAQFDVVWSQNVTMNVPDKAAMFAEAWRVLRADGVYVLTHLGLTPGADLDFPTPWAMTPETSFTTDPKTLIDQLGAAGFGDVTLHPQLPSAPPPEPGREQPGDNFAMGDDMPLRRANTARAVADGRLVPMLVTARRA